MLTITLRNANSYVMLLLVCSEVQSVSTEPERAVS